LEIWNLFLASFTRAISCSTLEINFAQPCNILSLYTMYYLSFLFHYFIFNSRHSADGSITRSSTSACPLRVTS
jgi:hypothetical protein